MHIAPLRDAHFGESGATKESPTKDIPSYLRHRWGDGDAREAGATRESQPSNLRHRWGDGDAREAGATRECTLPNLRYRWGDGDAREAGATRESQPSNLRHRWGDDGVLAPAYQFITFRMDYGIAILS